MQMSIGENAVVLVKPGVRSMGLSVSRREELKINFLQRPGCCTLSFLLQGQCCITSADVRAPRQLIYAAECIAKYGITSADMSATRQLIAPQEPQSPPKELTFDVQVGGCGWVCRGSSGGYKGVGDCPRDTF
eukprot:scaffold137377_cov19-Tisochrysis_lutea.AAC.1